MEVSLCRNLRSTQPSLSRQIPQSSYRGHVPAVVPAPGRRAVRLPVVSVKCVVSPAEKAAEPPEEDEEWMKSAELLECLEKEAIMGEDHGREPNDYNRRAQIFDQSSRVFQALKQRTTATTSTVTNATCTE